MSVPANADFSSRVQQIVDLLAQSLDRAVLLDDEDLTPITHSRQRGELDDVRVYSVLQRETRPAVKADLFDLGIRTATEALWTPQMPQHGLMPRFCVPVRSDAERFGYLWVLDPDGSLSAQGQQLARRAGSELQAVLDRRHAALRADEVAQQALLRQLISADTAELRERAVRELHVHGVAGPDAQVSVFVFEPEPGGTLDAVERAIALRLRLAASDTSHRWLTLSGKTMAIFAVSQPETPPATDHLAEAVAACIDATHGCRTTVGWSGERTPIELAAQGYQHSRLALRLARIGASDAQVAVWTRLGSWRALALLAESYTGTGADLTGLVHTGISGLIGQGRADLLHTLDVYLANGGDARKTAEELYVHRSTLYYRLERIAEAVGGDLGDGAIRFDLMLSLRLAQVAGLYRSLGGGHPTVV